MASAPAPSSSVSDRGSSRRLAGRWVALLLVGWLGVACTQDAATSNANATAGAGATANTTANATVVRAVDGDTILVQVDGVEERVRLIGINTPESVDPRRPVQCFGKAASHHTASLLPEGTPVRLVRDAEGRDKYGRLLAYVYRARDGLFVNLELVTNGYALSYPFPPNIAHVTEFAASQQAARSSNLGVWASCPNPTKQ